ncbi:MAG: ATP-dependent helicase, partial [Desulfobacula sp.]|nr:ATP-dependent helicase [Desulfobacula sp.]
NNLKQAQSARKKIISPRISNNINVTDCIGRLKKQTGPVQHKLEMLIDSYFSKEYKKHKRLFDRLSEAAAPFGDNFEDFIRFTSLGAGIDTWQQDSEAVSLMTLHASKGLEFDTVFIAGCEERLLPYSLFEDKISDPEEERRLLYVGMTRAKRSLHITHANSRFLMGKRYHLPRSLFLENIEKELLEFEKQKIPKKAKPSDGQISLFDKYTHT